MEAVRAEIKIKKIKMRTKMGKSIGMNKNARLRKANIIFVLLAAILLVLIVRAENTTSDNLTGNPVPESIGSADNITSEQIIPEEPVIPIINKTEGEIDINQTDINQTNPNQTDINETPQSNDTGLLPILLMLDITGTVTNNGPVQEGEEINFTGQCSGNSMLVVCMDSVACNAETEGKDLICRGEIIGLDESTAKCARTTTAKDVGTNSGIATCCNDAGECDTTTVLIAGWSVGSAVTMQSSISMDIKGRKKDFNINEDPLFDFEYIKNGKALDSPEKAFNKLVTKEETVEASVYDALGFPIEVMPEITKTNDGKFTLSLPKQRAFRPGKYTLQVALTKDGATSTDQMDFTWGVLAINPHKSIYLENEEAFIGIGVLDDYGRVICDADVTLEITAPDGKKTALTTADGDITISPECKVLGVTELPDYYTTYKVGSAGLYSMSLTAVTANGARSISDSFAVQDSVEFDVERKGPTRIYPPVPYKMDITIKANQKYNGDVKEYVPASFYISDQDGLTVTESGDMKILSWSQDMESGETYSLSYQFDAPDLSPYLFTLGELEIGKWKESRRWMIASDQPEDVLNSTFTASLDSWAAGLTVGAYTCEDDAQATAPTFTNPATGNPANSGNITIQSIANEDNENHSVYTNWTGTQLGNGITQADLASIGMSFFINKPHQGLGGATTKYAASCVVLYGTFCGTAGRKLYLCMNLKGNVSAMCPSTGGTNNAKLLPVVRNLGPNIVNNTWFVIPSRQILTYASNASAWGPTCTTYNVSRIGLYSALDAGTTTIIQYFSTLFDNIFISRPQNSIPTIALGNPLNNTFNNSANINFTYTPLDDTGFANCSLWFSKVLNQSNTTIGNNSLNSFTFTNLPEGRYNWSINCTDNSTVYKYNGTDERVLIIDRTGPTVTPITMLNGNTTTNNLTVNFTWQPIDVWGPNAQCNISINGTRNNTFILNVSNNTIANYTIGLNYGNYVWNVNCTDNATNLGISSMNSISISNISFNVSVLSLGVGSKYGANVNRSAMVISKGINNNVVVACLADPGNCTVITENWDDAVDLSLNQLNAVNFSCSAANSGNFTALYTVKSDEDPIVDNIYVSCDIRPVNISFNMSSLNLGSGTQGAGNKNGSARIDSNGTNNNVKVSCLPVPGNCTTILKQWDNTFDMTEGQSNTINFSCSDTAAGTFSAIFNVTSDNDPYEENITVSCTMASGNQPPADPSNFSIQDNGLNCAGQTDQWDQTNNNTHMDYHYGPYLNWTNGTDDNYNVKTKLCISSSKSCTDLQTDLMDGANEITKAAADCNIVNLWGNSSALATKYYNISNSTFAHNGSARIEFVVAARTIEDTASPLGSANVFCYNFSLNNSIPSGSTTIKAASTNSAATHLNGTTEKYKWTAATDPDTTVGKDHCPADTIVHNLRIGNATYGNDTYFSGQVANPATGTSLTTGVPFNITLVGSTFNSTMYAQMWADDSVGGNESRKNETLILYDTIPSSPSTFTVTATHDQTPAVDWTASSDPDGDTITYHITAGTAAGGTDILSEQTQTTTGSADFWSTTIPWGTDSLSSGWANDTIYINVWAVDNVSAHSVPAYNANKTGLDPSFVLGDYLPEITSVEIGDSTGYMNCSLDPLERAGCSITPQTHSNATNIAIRINATDLDADCDTAGNGFASIYMCTHNFSDAECTPQHYNYTWKMEAVLKSGSNCAYNLTNNLTTSNNTMPFWLANSTYYVYYVNVSNQAGQRPNETGDVNVNGTWTYSELTSVNYPSTVSLGGGTVILGIWNNGTVYTMTNWGNVILNTQWNTTNATNGPTNEWKVNGSNMMIDDDAKAWNEDAGEIIEVNMTHALQYFNYSTGLQRCLSDLCNDGTQNEAMPTYWHIAPVGLSSGTYSLNITYVTGRHA